MILYAIVKYENKNSFLAIFEKKIKKVLFIENIRSITFQ